MVLRLFLALFRLAICVFSQTVATVMVLRLFLALFRLAICVFSQTVATVMVLRLFLALFRLAFGVFSQTVATVMVLRLCSCALPPRDLRVFTDGSHCDGIASVGYVFFASWDVDFYLGGEDRNRNLMGTTLHSL
jgi:hypothetical protein